MSTKTFFLFVVLLVVGLGFVVSKGGAHSQIVTTSSPSARVLPAIARSVPGSCTARGPLPDTSCTPGATNIAVTQETIQQTICVQGYTKTIRPPVEYTDRIKTERMAAYSDEGSRKEYELDHLIPLEIGGDPSSILNLWPEPAAPNPGFHEKDVVENYLHQQVCSQQMTLAQAQQKISTNWTEVYYALPGSH